MDEPTLRPIAGQRDDDRRTHVPVTWLQLFRCKFDISRHRSPRRSTAAWLAAAKAADLVADANCSRPSGTR
jgi:hypothetical protein